MEYTSSESLYVIRDGLTGGRGLHTVRKGVVFHRSGVFYHGLGYIIIDGYSYATRLGWIFYVIFTRQANNMCRIILALKF